MPGSAQPLAPRTARIDEALDEAMTERLLRQVTDAASAIAANLGKFGAQDPPVHPAILHAAAAAVLSSAHKLSDAAARLDALASLGRPGRSQAPLGTAEVTRLIGGILRGPQPDGPWPDAEVAGLLARWLTGLGIDPAMLELPGART